MNRYFALAFCVLLCACTDTDWNRTLNYTGLNGTQDSTADMTERSDSAHVSAVAEPKATAVQPQAPAQDDSNISLCRAVATQDATSNDFDPPTQQRVFARSYAQCLAIYAR